MQLTGTITNIVSSGGYQGKYGYVYNFQMTIQCADGPHTGEIGSKTEIYPMNTGQEIVVEMTNSQHGPKFKKLDPNYNQGQPQNTQQAPPQAAQPTNAPQRDYDKENRGKCRFGFYCAVIRAGFDPVLLNAASDTLAAIERLVDKSMNGIGNVPAPVHQPIDLSNPADPDGIPF